MVSGHLVVDFAGRRAILDTGSPLSFGAGSLTLLGRPVILVGDGLGVSPEYLSEKIGTRIDALIGIDVLGQCYFELDCPSARCTFDTEAGEGAGSRVPLESMLGVPIAGAVIDGCPRRLIVDTGAQIGYLEDRLLRGRRALGSRVDFHPMLGEFTTEAHEVPVTIGGLDLSLVFGTMPDTVRMVMGMASADGILGTDIFLRHRVRLALPDAEMVLSVPTT